MRRINQRGEGQFGCLVGLVLLLVAGLVAYKMIPVKVKAAEMRDTIIDEAKSAGQNTDKQIKEAILRQATTLELPVTEENIKLSRTSTTMRIEIEYTVPVEFPGFTYPWKFRHTTENPIF